ncbi:MAG: S8 family serine peptidase, partial [Nitriliruptorales bacterium]|nr:S8 family serine peptidase [Nitriliruptorales bacterium]
YGMAVLARPIAELQDRGVVVVSSAGNDATCVPTVPAVMPGVIGVAALDEDGAPAPFTNYGPWVRACTFGQDVVSWFFNDYNGQEQPVDGGRDPDFFEGWARWSGTSFAAPRLVARLAAEMTGGASGHEAVARLIDDPERDRKPLLGTHVP